MPQETNLNVAPYFDDFDATKITTKVLFKPAYPIQARELNNIQSILPGQIEAMGDNILKKEVLLFLEIHHINLDFIVYRFNLNF